MSSASASASASEYEASQAIMCYTRNIIQRAFQTEQDALSSHIEKQYARNYGALPKEKQSIDERTTCVDSSTRVETKDYIQQPTTCQMYNTPCESFNIMTRVNSYNQPNRSTVPCFLEDSCS